MYPLSHYYHYNYNYFLLHTRCTVDPIHTELAAESSSWSALGPLIQGKHLEKSYQERLLDRPAVEYLERAHKITLVRMF